MDLIIISIAPILLLVIILLLLKKPLYVAAPITFIYTLLISITHFAIKTEYIKASIIKSILVSIDIILIIIGAILFLEYLKNTGFIQKIEQKIITLSPDKRVQAIIIIWFFGSFLEGTAGFGTPAAITAPLLVAIGFPAVLSVVLALIGNSTAVVFGAVGTPIRIGFSGLDIATVSQTAALINLFAGIIIPIILIWFITRYEKKSIKNFYEAIPFAIWSGICFLLPHYLLSFIGYEFPSLIGPIIGLAIIIYTTKKKILIPKYEEQKQENNIKKIEEENKKISLIKDFSPYIILTILLLIGKYILPTKTIIIEEGVTHNLSLYNPGIIFLITIIIMQIIFKIKKEHINKAINTTKNALIYPFISILFITGIVQLLILSNYNNSGTDGMLTILSNKIIGPNFIAISPTIGAFGSFLSGSATVSNILFGAYQYETAQVLGISTILILALQVVGAGIGNMISLTNIVAAQATVKLKNQEMNILKKTIIPAIIYLIIVTIIGIILTKIL